MGLLKLWIVHSYSREQVEMLLSKHKMQSNLAYNGWLLDLIKSVSDCACSLFPLKAILLEGQMRQIDLKICISIPDKGYA